MRAKLLRAAAAGKLDEVRALLLEAHAQARASVGLGRDSPLDAVQLASLHAPEIAAALLAGGAACDLHSACALGRADDIRRLATVGNLGALAEHLTPMGFALLGGGVEAVRALLDAGDDPNRPLRRVGFHAWELDALAAGHGRWSPLHAACVHGYAPRAADVVALLLEAGADPDAASPLGARPIHLAAAHGWTAVLATLVAHGVPVDSRTGAAPKAVWRMSAPPAAVYVTGLTPLMIAAREGKLDAARWCLAHGAAVNSADGQGMTALHWASHPWWGENPELATALLDAGADHRARDAAGRTPADVAEQAGFSTTLGLLRTAGAG